MEARSRRSSRGRDRTSIGPLTAAMQALDEDSYGCLMDTDDAEEKAKRADPSLLARTPRAAKGGRMSVGER